MDPIRFAALLIAAAMSAAPAQLAHTAAADPATDLVAVRLLLTTTASGVELSVENAQLANGLFTTLTGPAGLRTRSTDNTISISGNSPAASATVQVDAILAGVRARTSVGWTVTLTSDGSAVL